jgi:hypothetical protein
VTAATASWVLTLEFTTPVSSVQPLSPNRGISLPIPQNEIPVHSDSEENPSEPNFSKKRKRDSKNQNLLK